MNKQELALLERAFEADVNGALSGAPRLIQPRNSKALHKAVADGLLEPREARIAGRFPVVIKGYGLTLLGNFTYCMTCDAPTYRDSAGGHPDAPEWNGPK